MSLQKECQFIQRVTPGVGPLFAPLEETLWDTFIPDLSGGIIEEVADYLCNLTACGVKQ